MGNPRKPPAVAGLVARLEKELRAAYAAAGLERSPEKIRETLEAELDEVLPNYVRISLAKLLGVPVIDCPVAERIDDDDSTAD